MNEKEKKEFSKKYSENILSILKTKENANQFNDFVKFLSSETFSTEKFDINEAVVKKYGDKVPYWFDGIKEALAKSTNLELVRHLLFDLEKIIDNAVIVKAELPFVPSDDFVEGLYEVIRDSKVLDNPNGFLIEFNTEMSIAGDVKINVGGRYIDGSLRKIIVNYLETNDVIKRYL